MLILFIVMCLERVKEQGEQMMTDVFISYASANADVANELRSNLEKAGIVCWIAPRDIPPGSEYGAEIIKGIENAGVFLLCLTKDSNISQHVAREVERAVNKNLPILTYQYEKVELSKSLEYFLASTQWFTPNEADQCEKLANSIHSLLSITDTEKKLPTNIEEKSDIRERKSTKNSMTWLWLLISAILLLCIGVGAYLSRNPAIGKQTQTAIVANSVKPGDTFSFGTMEYNGDNEALSWIVLQVDTETNTVLCIAENIVAFQPYDVAESGNRGKIGELYFNENSCSEYTTEQLQMFWGNADWAASNIRTWLNSSDASVPYTDMAPINDGTTIYENGYDTNHGFLYFFSDEEKSQLVSHESFYQTAFGTTMKTQDSVFLFSKEEVKQFILDQNILLSAIPTAGAVDEEESGVYSSYVNEGEPKTYWALRDYGDIPACTVLCAGNGMDHTKQFHSEYACDSLLGIRPAIVLPLSYVESLAGQKE